MRIDEGYEYYFGAEGRKVTYEARLYINYNWENIGYGEGIKKCLDVY